MLFRHLPSLVRRFGTVPENADGLAKARALAAQARAEPCASDSALWGKGEPRGGEEARSPG